MTNPRVAHVLHAQRHRELVARAAAYRLRKQWRTTQRSGRTNGRRHRWLDDVIGRTHHDQKIVRLRESWLAPNNSAAKLLARAADEVDLRAGSVLEAGRFGYIGLDGAHVGLVVGVGTPSVTLDSDATALVLTTHDLEELARLIPMLADAMSRALAIPRPGEVPPSQRQHTPHGVSPRHSDSATARIPSSCVSATQRSTSAVRADSRYARKGAVASIAEWTGPTRPPKL